MSVRGVSLLCGLLAVAIGASGCVAVAVGAGAAGTVAYLAGDLEAHQSHDVDTVFAASKQALADLQMTVIEGRTTKDALGARIVARDATDKEIVVNLKATVVGATDISIRVGTFGDDTKSHLIYEKIRENLKEASI